MKQNQCCLFTPWDTFLEDFALYLNGGNMNINFSGRVVLVAGGTGGLGNAVSLAFLQENAKVVVTYHKQEEYDAFKSAAGANATALEGYLVDVTDERATTEFVARILSQHGRLDALVNTVGGYAGGVKLWDLETKVFDTMLSLTWRQRRHWITGRALVRMLRQRPPHWRSSIRLLRMRRGLGYG
jgi:NAD(P)-dependent dehydrogenase (short-subunit alcohol dehydrogenase family)